SRELGASVPPDPERSEPASPVAEPGIVAQWSGRSAVGVAPAHRPVRPADRGVAGVPLAVEARIRFVVAIQSPPAPQLMLSEPPVVAIIRARQFAGSVL